MAERDALGQDRAGQVRRVARGRLGARCRQRRQFARGDHLGEHHRRGLQRLDLFLDIVTLGAILHHQHAERVAGAQDRNAKERVVDFLAGFRAVGKCRMALGVRQVQRGGLAGDQTDQSLMRVHDGLVYRLAVQAFGGVKLEVAVMAQHIGRAHLGHHVGRDQHDDLVEPFLCRDLLRHDFAEPSQQDAWSSQRAPHLSCPSCRSSLEGRCCPRRCEV